MSYSQEERTVFSANGSNGSRNNTTMDTIQLNNIYQPMPHWTVILLSFTCYFVCIFLGLISAALSLHRLISHKHVRRSHWPTIVLLAGSLFVAVVLVPLEVTRTSLNFFNISIYGVCHAQLFSVVMSRVLAFSSTVTTAVMRVRKIHNPFQRQLPDLPERICVSLCFVLSLPVTVGLSYWSHLKADKPIIFEQCLGVSPASTTSSEITVFLNLLEPVSFLTVLITLICVYMNGIWHIKQKTSSGAIASASRSQLSSSWPSTLLKSSPVRPSDRQTRRPCTAETFLTKAEISSPSYEVGETFGSDVTNKCRQLIPRESMTSTDYRQSTSSSNPAFSSRSSYAESHNFLNSEQSQKSSFTSSGGSYEPRKDSETFSRFALRKSRKSQYSLPKALRKISAVSMLSIDTIPETPGVLVLEAPQLLHPLRHTRRSASNMWLAVDVDSSADSASHKSGPTKSNRTKLTKCCSSTGSRSQDATASSPGSTSAPLSEPSMLQKYKRRMSQTSRGSIMSDVTHISTGTYEDLELLNIENDNCTKTSLQQMNSVEQETDTQSNMDSHRRSCSPALSLSESLSLRQPLPPIAPKRPDSKQKDQSSLHMLDNAQLPMQSIIQTWGRCPPSDKLLRRSHSLINFYPNNHQPIFESFEEPDQTPEANKAKFKTFVSTSTQTEAMFDTTGNAVQSTTEMNKQQSQQEQHQQIMPARQHSKKEKPMIRIIRPSLPHKQQETKVFEPRQVLLNNWCSQDRLSSGAVPKAELHSNRHNNSLGRGSLFSQSSIFMHRNEMDIKRMFKRSVLLILAFLSCFLPSTMMNLTAFVLSTEALTNVYALSRVAECIYFTIIPFLYVYTNASLMKMINRKTRPS